MNATIVIVIPAYEPDARLVALVRRLRKSFAAFVVVDDGSRSSGGVFDELRGFAGVTVLAHPANRGKGAALRTAFAEVLRRHPDAIGAVTADADGQHHPDDIVRVARSLRDHPDRMTIGTRTFARDVPFRSRLGNLWTVAEFRLLTGTTIRDTQSGLRAIPRALLDGLSSLPGDRYDYEITMLVKAVRSGRAPVQIPIRTIYEDGNATSHFRPLRDTFSTQRALFAAALGARFRSAARAD